MEEEVVALALDKGTLRLADNILGGDERANTSRRNESFSKLDMRKVGVRWRTWW